MQQDPVHIPDNSQNIKYMYKHVMFVHIFYYLS